jgi:benzoate-CoA ligase
MTDIAGVAAPPDRYNFAADLMARSGHWPDRGAYVDDHGAMTYRELMDRVRRCASGLESMGLRREDRVLLVMQDSHHWPVAFLGALYAGVVPVAVNTLLPASDYAYMIDHSGVRAVIVTDTLLPVVETALDYCQHDVRFFLVSGVLPAKTVVPGVAFEPFLAAHPPREQPAGTRADDMAFWLYSSGSTGRPKGTVHAQGSLYWTAELYGKGVLDLRTEDTCFSAAKLFFAYGLGNSLSFPLSVGATTILMAGRATPEAVIDRWLKHRPTVFFGAPTGYAALLASPALPGRDQVALRLCSSAGEALPEDIGRRFSARFGIDVCDGIGSTEMLHIFLSNAPGRVRYGTTGWPVPGYDIELRGEDGQPVTRGETGELFIRGPSSAVMYWANRQKSRDVFQGMWTRSGDRYLQNEDGSYSCVGRADDMFKVSGQFVSPVEVEGALIQHPAVLESAVVGLPDADGLIKSKAFVVLKPGRQVNESELQDFVKVRLAPWKYPRSIEFVSELPKTATGKIMRYRLRS